MKIEADDLYSFKNERNDRNLMQQFATPHSLRNEILSLVVESGLNEKCYTEMLDYTIELFETQGLGSDYYGYHNINHELEVTYMTLLASNWNNLSNEITKDDIKYLYAAALFHDFDPQKNVDKPHEESVLRFIAVDKKLQELVYSAGLDIEIIKALILRTTYPWSGELRKSAEEQILQCFKSSPLTKNNEQMQVHIMKLGWFLSVVDRISGYALGDFSKAMEMAKMNAHALAWHPSLIVRSSVAYFEELLNKETEMCQRVLKSIPKHMRKNFFNSVLAFMNLRQQEIKIHADYVYEDLRFVPTIENMKARNDDEFIKILFSIYEELPRPLQFAKNNFEESIKDSEVILNTLRIGNTNGEIIGFAKGGPLENYELRPEIKDENYGLNNTVFLEPLALKMGYWGLHGGSEMRHLFIMQAHAKKYKYLTSFALRDVIRRRIASNESAEFVTMFDPERWDYYRIQL